MVDAAFYRKIRDEVTTGGLRHERQRLDDARCNLAFYQGNFEAYAPKGIEGYDKIKPRYSLLMQRVVNVLTGNLYKEGPKRSLPDHAQAGKWLDAIYKANAIDAQFMQADRYATATDAAAFQVMPNADPRKPVRVYLWDASQLVVWLDPDDQTRPAAVGVQDVFNEQRRLRVYTPDLIDTYLTEALKPGQTSGGTAFTLRSSKPNPLKDLDGNGLIPFSFVHFNLPLCDFWTYGPGTFLRSVNDAANLALTQVGGCIRYNLIPILVGKGLPPGWRPPSPIRPGDVWTPPTQVNSSSEEESAPDFSYLQADSSFVAAGWDDLQNYLDHTLEMAGVPPGAVRMVQDSARSGVSIQAEQWPLVTWAKGRQRPFSHYEDGLARLVLTIGATHLELQEGDGYKATASQLAAAAEDPGLQLRWPKMYAEMPGPEADMADDWLLQHQMASRTSLLMRRENMTRDEARKYLEEIAEDLDIEDRLMAGVGPASDDAAKKQAAAAAKDDEKPEADDAAEPEPKAEDDEREDD